MPEGERRLGISTERTVLLPPTLDIFTRDRSIPARLPSFSPAVKTIAIVPIREELDNSHLAEYLTIINRQQGDVVTQNFGFVFLVNDHAGDQENEKVLKENSQTTQYLSYLSRKELPPDDFAIPSQYGDIAEAIIRNDAIEIRVDQVHSSFNGPHFGKQDLHLMNLAYALKSPEVTDTDAVLHFHNVDMRIRRYHLDDISGIYQQHPELLYNTSIYDLIPGRHEGVGEQEQDKTRELLLYLDQYRLFEFGSNLQRLLVGNIGNGAPTLSARFSYLYMYGQVHPHLAYRLEHAAVDQDFILNLILHKARRSDKGNVEFSGREGEVYFLHRARTSTKSATEKVATDAERAYQRISDKTFYLQGIEKKFDLLTEADIFIGELEERVGVTSNETAVLRGHRQDYREKNTYKNLLEDEYEYEQYKVMKRGETLRRYITSQANDTELSDDDKIRVAPFLHGFRDEVAFIQTQIHSVKAPEDVESIAEVLIKKYDSFFNPHHEIHLQIARLRALMRYVFDRRISILEHLLESENLS